MKICRIYANKLFKNIEFNDGFNVVLAEITDKTFKENDTHNPGKTLLISVIDFLLLKGVDDKSKFFLARGGFESQMLFAEIQLNNGKYLVIRRGVDNPTKISFKLNEYKLDSFKMHFDWDDEDMPIKKAKAKLNEYLAFDVLPNWDYRKPITYFLRTQHDFRDVFKLDKFKGKDKDWKPFMFDMLGFNGSIIKDKYELENGQEVLGNKLSTLQQEADIKVEEKDKIQGLLDIKKSDIRKIEADIDKFNFYEKDKNVNQDLVEKKDSEIQALNTQRYNITFEIKKTERSLNTEPVSINIDKLKRLYNDVSVYFPDDLVNDFEKLMAFNKSLTEERNGVLEENLNNLRVEFHQVDNDLKMLEKQKEDALSYLLEKDSYAKFKANQKQLAKVEADIIRLEDKLKAIDRTAVIIEDMEKTTNEINKKIKEIHKAIGEQKHKEIRKLFNSIIDDILNTNALVSIKQNKQGNIEFEANIQNPVDSTITAEDAGNTYRKLLCVAFDLSLLINYSGKSFYRFAYHDGALEGLDDRKKTKLLELVRKICRDYNLQYIITLIDSDLPKDDQNKIIKFSKNEICLTLHDKDDSGKLFLKSF